MLDFLILGKGWIGDFLVEHLDKQNLTWKATTTTGRDGTIKWKYQDDSTSGDYKLLPQATTVVITFPFPSLASPDIFCKLYACKQYILLGSTRAFVGRANENGPVEPDLRFQIEDKFLKYGTVLNLAGLYGKSRLPKNWISRVAATKESLLAKTSLHLIHGNDVARLLIAAHFKFVKKRWIVTDLRVYDWWELCLSYGQCLEWINEFDFDTLPRDSDKLVRVLNSRNTWTFYGLLPSESLLQQ